MQWLQAQQAAVDGSVRDSADSDTKELEAELDEVKAKLSDLRERSAASKERAEAAAAESEASVAELKSQIRGLVHHLEQKAARVESLEGQQAGFQGTISSLQESVTEMESKKLDLQSQLQALQEREEHLEAETAHLRQDLKAALEKKGSLDDEEQLDGSEVGTLRQQVFQLEGQLQSAEGYQKQLEQDKEKLDSQLQQHLFIHERGVDRLVSRMAAADRASSELQRLQDQLTASKQQIALLSTELTTLQAANLKLQDRRMKGRGATSGPGSPVSPGSPAGESVSEADSPVEILEKNRGMSVKEIQQQHVFQLNSQLQDLEHKNQRATSKLREAVAAKEELQKRVTELETISLAREEETQLQVPDEARAALRQTNTKDLDRLQNKLTKSVQNANR